jgi:hypothetical protein
MNCTGPYKRISAGLAPALYQIQAYRGTAADAV